MSETRRIQASKYSLIVPSKGYSPKSDHASTYKNQIKKIAKRQIPEPLYGEIEVKLEYLYRDRRDRLDGDNLLKTVCDGLKEAAYDDDSQVIDQRVKIININSSFEIRGVPLNQQIADLLASQTPFAIIRLRQIAQATNDETNLLEVD